MDEMTLKLNNPLTEEEWDLIEDVDFDKTNSIEFHTKHGKTVKFVKCTDEKTEDMISRQAAIALAKDLCVPTKDGTVYRHRCIDPDAIKELPSAQPEYEELTPEEAASKIASSSIMSAWYWFDLMIRLNQMGYAICRRREE